MRLIDADKLEAYGTTVPKECNAEDYLCGTRDILEHIDSMPTIDAIPIKWIENALTEIGDDSPYRPAIEWLLITYKMEREEKYVTLHHEDIHFIDEDAERAYYESLADRKED